MGKLDLTPKINQKFPLQMWGINLGMYEVKEDNWAEFFVRIQLMAETLDVPMLRYESGEAVPITPELAKQHIGCRLGDRNEDREKWWLRIMRHRATGYENQVRDFDPDQFPLPELDVDDL